MSVRVDFFTSTFLFQALDTEVKWNWELTDADRAMFYTVVQSSTDPLMNYTRLEVTRLVQCGQRSGKQRSVEIRVKLDYDGPEKQRPTQNLGLINFHAVRAPGV